jgi:ribose transport system substrate-binding protein
MKISGRILAILLIAGLLLSMTGCSGNRLATQEKRTHIKVIVKKKDAAYWTVVKMGADAAAKEFDVDVDFDGPADEKDIDGQIRMVEEAITARADAIVLGASDYNKLVDVAEKAVDAGIPVVVIDSDIHSDRTVCFIGTDNVDAGRMLGRTLIEKVGEECSIAVMSFVKGAASSDQRDEGLYETIRQYGSVRVLSSEYCYSDEAVAEKLTGELVYKYPGLDAIICTNAYGTTGTARAIDKLGKAEKIKVIGFDSTPEEIRFMEKDVVQSLVVQNPFSMGYLGVKRALDALHGKTVEKRINTGSKAIDKNNMYDPENEKLLFPFTK